MGDEFYKYKANYNDYKGVRYNEADSLKEIAKKIRSYIKNEKNAGNIPKGMKFSVRMRHYSALHVTIMDFPDDMEFWNLDYFLDVIRLEKEGRNYNPNLSRFVPKIRKIIEDLDTYVNSYNHDRSDIQTDYFDVRFYYSTVELDWKNPKTDYFKYLEHVRSEFKNIDERIEQRTVMKVKEKLKVRRNAIGRYNDPIRIREVEQDIYTDILYLDSINEFSEEACAVCKEFTVHSISSDWYCKKNKFALESPLSKVCKDFRK